MPGLRTSCRRYNRRLPTVVAVRPLQPFRVWLRFSDETEGVADLADLVERGEVFTSLRDADRIARLRLVKSFGTFEWPGGVDIDLDSLYARFRAGTGA